MPIDAKEPIEIPAKVFNKYWVSTIEISAPSPSEEAIANCRLVPLSASGEVAPELATNVQVRDILTKSQDANSNIAKAMFFLLAAINDEYLLQNQGE